MFSTERTIYIQNSPSNKSFITNQKRYCQNLSDKSMNFGNNNCDNFFTNKTLQDDFNEKENGKIIFIPK